MNVPEGFKQTEVGVIPKDWEAVSFSDVILSTQLGGNYQTNSVDNGFPLIKMGNLGRGNIVLSKIEFIALPINISERDRLEYGDVLFNTRNTLELVGKVAIWRNDLPIAHFNSNIMRICFDSRKIGSNFFMNYILNSIGLVSQLKSIAIGTTSVAAIYSRDLFKIKIPLPPTRAEQTAIAAALSDMDALIEGVEKLLEKKRRIKQGAMQELLTGKRRVSGFESQAGFQQTEVGVIPKDWKVIKLSDLSSMKSGETITSKNIYETDRYPCYGGNGLRGYTSSYTHDGDFALIGRQGALCGNVQFANGNFFASEHAIVVTPQERTDIKWLYYMLLAMNLNQYSESSAQPGLSVEKINKLPIPLPPSRAEQTAIAAILSDMDSEIQQLETQLTKYRQLKTGMMQELLTGKKRLV